MPYNKRYTVPFISSPHRDKLETVKPVQWELAFWGKDYTGSVTELCLNGDDAVTLETVDNDDSRFGTTVIGTKLTANLECDARWQFDSLFVEGNRDLLVTLDYNAGTPEAPFYRRFWTGWVKPEASKEPYSPKPYFVTVSAECGLASLKDTPLTDILGKRLSGVDNISNVLRTALRLTGHELPFSEVDNLYELSLMTPQRLVNGVANPAIDPLHETKLRRDSFVTDKNLPLNALETLERIALCRGAKIIQHDGDWWFVRRSEIAGGWNPLGPVATVNRRRYAFDNFETSSAASIGLGVTVDLDGNVRALSGGTTWWQSRLKRLAVSQQFGGYVTNLKNGTFSDLDGPNQPTNWTIRNFQPGEVLRGGEGTEANPHYLELRGLASSTFNYTDPSVVQRVQISPLSLENQIYALNQEYGFTLTGRFRIQNTRGALVAVLATVVTGEGDTIIGPNGPIRQPKLGVAILKADGSWKLNPSRRDMVAIPFNHVSRIGGVEEKAENYWQKPKLGYGDIEITTAPLKGILYVDVYLKPGERLDGQPATPQSYIRYYDIRVNPEDPDVTLDGQTITEGLTLPLLESPPDPDATHYLGDVPDVALADKRLNTLLRVDGQTPTTTWYNPNDGDRLNGRNLLAYNTTERFADVASPSMVWEGELVGNLPMGPLTVLYFTDVTRNGGRPPFEIVRYRFDVQRHYHRVTAVEVRQPVTVQRQRHWDTPDGPVLQEEDPATGKEVGIVKRLDEVGKKIGKVLVSYQKKPAGGRVGADELEGYVEVDEDDELPTLYVGVKNRDTGKLIGSVAAKFRKIIDLDDFLNG
ncbi:hypothetical protein DYU11_19980 [Fibrisoma montanum]|uniref:Uncharacterized protein n=1 Tax=Fibrisoma montanum TaxID=2305895 RepID=A0A418M3W2_9BACT|nr:hypothetical protein [Fibrisoma montanum]RIV20333.1 hypothetical protein DYU11_19980 [Fibrisoma montanum]